MKNNSIHDMKASEIIKILQAEIDKRGDLEVVLHGAYGADSETFEIMDEKKHIHKSERGKYINVWTDIMTG